MSIFHSSAKDKVETSINALKSQVSNRCFVVDCLFNASRFELIFFVYICSLTALSVGHVKIFMFSPQHMQLF